MCVISRIAGRPALSAQVLALVFDSSVLSFPLLFLIKYFLMRLLKTSGLGITQLTIAHLQKYLLTCIVGSVTNCVDRADLS